LARRFRPLVGPSTPVSFPAEYADLAASLEHHLSDRVQFGNAGVAGVAEHGGGRLKRRIVVRLLPDCCKRPAERIEEDAPLGLRYKPRVGQQSLQTGCDRTQARSEIAPVLLVIGAICDSAMAANTGPRAASGRCFTKPFSKTRVCVSCRPAPRRKKCKLSPCFGTSPHNTASAPWLRRTISARVGASARVLSRIPWAEPNALR
jgi:hypothetical protein